MTTYTLMVSRNCGISYEPEYQTEDRDDATLLAKITEATAKVRRFYLDGDAEIRSPLFAQTVELLGGPAMRGPYATTSMTDKVSRLTRAWKG